MDDVSIDETLSKTWASISARGQDGDFTPEPNEPTDPEPIEPADPAGPTEPIEPVEPQDPQDPADPAEPQDAQSFRPPWKKAALADWEKLPESARREIERRESDFHKGIEQYKAGAQSSQEWDRTIQPYMATIQSFGVTPQVAVSELLKADHMLRYSQPQQKIGMLLKIANDYGVDLQTLANGIQNVAGEQVWQQQNPADPRLQQLQQQIGQLTQHITNTQQQASAAEHSAIDAEIAEFAADPDHEHFGILQHDMAAFLQSGLAKDLDDAYEKAMRANPQTYQIWLAQQQQEWDDKRKAQVRQAKQAGANVVRPNGRASVPAAQPNRTMEEDIEATARSLGLLN
ncbi:hypothetical protein PIN31115_02082 [Pandoraea iniqua]|uniref:Uncharacterized protein n=1 Tax=Pandoraea iniqua TaxID=2508288 RepID=A0A5E4UNA7_9BURK|nr:hypothetical protein [Pandoraea iniqua]VVE00569.1 hypothetical protein PIN31115_02082 [Pandoraea iniqua]